MVGEIPVFALPPPSDIFTAGLLRWGPERIYLAYLTDVRQTMQSAGMPSEGNPEIVVGSPPDLAHYLAIQAAWVAASLPPDAVPPPGGFGAEVPLLLATMAEHQCSLPEARTIAQGVIRTTYSGGDMEFLVRQNDFAFGQLAPLLGVK